MGQLRNAPPAADSFDWSNTQLGDRAPWPPALRVTVDIVLHSPLPMLLVWGGERIVVLNEAYSALAGPRQARVPGGNVPPIWPVPLVAGRAGFECAERGRASVMASATLSFMRENGPRQCVHDLYFTPIRGDGGAVSGVLCSLGPAQEPAAEPAPAAGALRILVVEDNLDSQFLVCEMLRALGHEAGGTACAEDALVLLAGAHYDVLFSDVSLPGISGVELARQALAAQPSLQVIFASGYGDALLRHVEFAFVSLQKPYELDQLQDVLAGVLRAFRGPP